MNYQLLANLENWLGQQIVGQQDLIHKLMLALLANGHLLVEGAPGLAKTRAIKEMAEGIEGSFHRIQFTPDLLPGDITGTDLFRPQTGAFEFQQGPIFNNLVLADEINRAPAKVQSALLEAMAERQVSIGSQTYELPSLFLVMATQNPIEQEGTYPLPEAQLDRFMFLVEVDYPSEDEERRIARETTGVDRSRLNALITGQEVLEFQKLVRRMPVPDHIYDYAVELVRKTRPNSDDAPSWIKEYVGWGAGPRAVQYLVLGAKGRAALRGNYMASLEDIEAVAVPVLTHRVITNFAAESQGMTSKRVVERLIEEMRED